MLELASISIMTSKFIKNIYDVSSAEYQFHSTPSPFYPPPKPTDKKFKPLQISFYNIREFMEHLVIQTFLNLDAYNLILSKSIHIYHSESRNVGSLISTSINRAIPGLIVHCISLCKKHQRIQFSFIDGISWR